MKNFLTFLLLAAIVVVIIVLVKKPKDDAMMDQNVDDSSMQGNVMEGAEGSDDAMMDAGTSTDVQVGATGDTMQQ